MYELHKTWCADTLLSNSVMCAIGVLRNIYTMASRLISAISDPRPRYQPEAKPRARVSYC